jgi:hypothetical protein
MSAKVPVAIACSLIAFALGALAGVSAMSGFGYKWGRQVEGTEGTPPLMPAGAGGPAGGGGRGPGGGGGRGPGGGGGGGRTAMSKAQLTTLVGKLDQLTQRPIFIELNSDQKKKIREQLQGLSEKDLVSDEDAKTRLDALLELLKDKKETLEEAGYRWPGAGGGGGFGGGGFGGGGGQQPANPFKEGDGNKHLKSLLAVLSKG